MSDELLRYKRNHFSARLPVRFLYSASHFWLAESSPDVWRIGLTNFATRMLGEIVEFDIETKAGTSVSVGETIGWIEGFKAISDLFCVGEGTIEAINETAQDDCELICSKPYDAGWLYSIRGKPDKSATDVHGYVSHLDATIDKMLDQPWKTTSLDNQGSLGESGKPASPDSAES